MFVAFFMISFSILGQHTTSRWFSESDNNGVVIQTSYPKGGPYPGHTEDYFNYSYLVFYMRVSNETDRPLELSMDFSADSIAIPNSPSTFVKLFLPQDTMSLEKVSLLSYGITELESLICPTYVRTTIEPKEDFLFYMVAVFYQTEVDAWRQERGGNRVELKLKGQDLFLSMPPQVNSMPCGKISFSH